MTNAVDGAAPGPAAPGHLRVHSAVRSAHLANERDVVVALPPGYDTEPGRRYPVLYMHDGQNLFDPATSFAGQIWAVDQALAALVAEGRAEPVIVVGIHNTGIHRIDEYTPSPDPRFGQGGKANLYGRFLVEELKPMVDACYRTDPAREATGLAGSSLGGLVTLHLGLVHGDVFGRLAALSPSVWWNGSEIVGRVRAIDERPDTPIWLDMGTREGPGQLARTRALRDALVEKGWTPGRDLGYYEARNARHTERAWGRRIGMVLSFLYPRREARTPQLAPHLAAQPAPVELPLAAD